MNPIFPPYKITLKLLVSLLLICSACTPTPSSTTKSRTPWETQLGTHNFGSTCFANSTHKLLWSYYRDLSTPPTLSTSTLSTHFNALMAHFTQSWNQARNQTLGSDHGFCNELSLLFDAFEDEETSHGQINPITFQAQDGAETYLGRLNQYAQLFPEQFGIQKRTEFVYFYLTQN